MNRPSDNLITFRMKNPMPDRLKATVEKLVTDLQDVEANDKVLKFEFQKIEILEPGGHLHAFSGTVLPSNRFSLAIKRRSTEWNVGLAAMVAALILLILSIPPIRNGMFNSIGEWGVWITGFMDRLSTSALVTWTVSWLNVFLYWFDLRRKAVVIWEA